MFCRHSYRYTQGYFYCVKCGHRSYRQKRRGNASAKKAAIAAVLVIGLGATIFLLYNTELAGKFQAADYINEDKRIPQKITLEGCQMTSDGKGSVDVTCEGYDTLNLWGEPPLNSATVNDITLTVDNGKYNVRFMVPTGVTVSYDLVEMDTTGKPQTTEIPKEIDSTIKEATKKAEEIKETIRETIPKEPVQIPKSTVGKPQVIVSELERKVHNLINEQRIQRNLAPLVWDDNISNIARGHSQDMAARNYFDHDSPEGLGPSERGFPYGYYECGDREMILLSQKYDQMLRQFEATGSTNEQMYRQLQAMYSQLSAGQGMIFLGLAENIFQNNLYDRVWYTNGIPTSYEWNTVDEIAESTVLGWMNSPGHRQNILTPHFYSEGIGVAISGDDKVYITQNFC